MLHRALSSRLVVITMLALVGAGPGAAQFAPAAAPAAAEKGLALSMQVGARPPSPWPNLEEVIVVSKTHFDIGYTDLASRVVDRYRTSMADRALKLVDQSAGLLPDQRFSWTLAGWPMAQMLWPEQTPERRKRLVAAMRAGRLVPHALAFTTHTESLDLEDLTRGYVYSAELARLAGQPLPTGAKMTDVPSHAWAMATIMAHAGVKFFHIGCNGGCTHPDVPLLFWWEGPDGSRLLTMLSSEYGSSLQPPPDWPHKTWLCMWMTGDNRGPPNTQEVHDLFTRAQKELPNVRVRFGRMSDFAEAILGAKPQLPVVRGDMPDTWIHGIGSMPIETQRAHATRPRIAALESLDTLGAVWGVSSGSARATVREAYEKTLLFGEHTWGPDVNRYAGYHYGDAWKNKLAAGDYRFLLEGFGQKRAYAQRAAELVDPAIDSRMAALAAAVKVTGPRIVVFNPLPWRRDGSVDVPWFDPTTSVADVASGQIAPAATDGGRLRFVAKDLPPMGYRTFVPGARPAQGRVAANTQTRSIENEFLRVTLDPVRCGVCSIVDKKTGRELVNSQSPYALGQYLYERFDTDQVAEFTSAYVKSPTSGEMISHGKPNLPPAKEFPYRAATAAEASLDLRSDAVSATALLRAAPRGTIADATQLRVTLHAGQPWLDLEWSIAHKTPDPWPEAGWLCFPLRADNPGFRLSRLGAIVDPAEDLVRSANHEVFCLNGGLVVTDDDANRTGICPIDGQLVSLGRPGLWRYTREFAPRSADVFVMLFNNVYSTNFAQWIEGSWSSRVRLWVPDNEQSTEETLIGDSWEARDGCLAAMSHAAPGALPPTAAGLSITKKPIGGEQPAATGRTRRGLLVTAFGPNPYGDGTLLRFWDQAGNAGTYTIGLPDGMQARNAQPCDLRGQVAGSPITISDRGTFDFTIRRMSPASLILRSESAE
jgi:glycosyl hydrolase family 38